MVNGGDSALLQLRAGGQQLVPVLGLGDAELPEDVAAIVDAPLVVGVGHAPLLPVAGHGGLDGRERLAEPFLLPQIGDVLEQTGVDERTHAVARIPGRHVRRGCRQEVANRGLVRFPVVDVVGDVDVGIGRLELGDGRFERLLGTRIRVVEVDDEVAGECGGREHCAGRRRREGDLDGSDHGFLPPRHVGK